MTHPAASHDDDTTGPATCGALRRRLEQVLDEEDQLVAEIRAGIAAGYLLAGADFQRRLTLHTTALRELRADHAGHVFADAFQAGAAAQAQPAPAQPAAGRHRAQPALAPVLPLPLRPAHGIALAAILAAAKGHAISRIARALTAGTVAAGAGAGAATIYTMRTVPDQAPAVPQQVAVTPAAAAPSGPLLAAPAPRGRHHARRERHRAAALVLPPPASRPASPPLSPSPSVSPSAPPGVLNLPVSLTAGPAGSALLAITAQGGPVTWAATATPGLTLDVHGGLLAAGGAAEVTVTVDPALRYRPGSGTVTVNGQPVQVTWG